MEIRAFSHLLLKWLCGGIDSPSMSRDRVRVVVLMPMEAKGTVTLPPAPRDKLAQFRFFHFHLSKP